jgi:hypothetical protein
MPAYAGRWRVLVPLAALGRNIAGDHGPAGSGNGTNAAGAAATGNGGGEGGLLRPALVEVEHDPIARGALVDTAEHVARIVGGDIGVVESGLNPALYVVSELVRGVGRALTLRHAVAAELGITAEIVTDVDYERRRSGRLDWAKVVGESAARRLSSPVTKDLGGVIAALNRIPRGTMLRAMTAFAADFNCADPLFRIITAPIPAGHDIAGVRRLLQAHTGQPFDVLDREQLS